MYINNDDIQTIADALRRVRAAFPEGRHIAPAQSSGISVQLSASGARVMHRKFRHRGAGIQPSMGGMTIGNTFRGPYGARSRTR